jgi:hypothetical protein
VGLFAGFAVAAVLLSLTFFGGFKPGKGPGIGFFLQPLLFFGCVLLGGALGSAIGSRLPVPVLPPGPPEDPARRQARQRATGRAVVFGLFSGFFGGFVLFGVSQIVLRWEPDNIGVTAALFFGSILGGALLGAVTCGVVVNRLYRRR